MADTTIQQDNFRTISSLTDKCAILKNRNLELEQESISLRSILKRREQALLARENKCAVIEKNKSDSLRKDKEIARMQRQIDSFESELRVEAGKIKVLTEQLQDAKRTIKTLRTALDLDK